jgi:hypothetical protein
VVIAGIFGAKRLPSLIGMLLTIQAAGNFAGAPLAGAIKDSSGFTAAILYAGAVTAASTIFAFSVRYIQEKKILKRV